MLIFKFIQKKSIIGWRGVANKEKKWERKTSHRRVRLTGLI
jgi:hypothetical protein